MYLSAHAIFVVAILGIHSFYTGQPVNETNIRREIMQDSTVLFLNFSSLTTSHAGNYTCRGISVFDDVSLEGTFAIAFTRKKSTRQIANRIHVCYI